jgi:probable phosphoglycerate mutase
MPHHTILTLIRHGETSANLQGVWHGSIDTPLTERGLSQARRVAEYVAEKHADAAALYASDLQRARETARAIEKAVNVPLRLDPSLREYDLGSWEGKSYKELHEEHRLWHHMKHDPDFSPHGGESPRQVTDRMTGTLRKIAAGHPGERVLVVGHGGVLAMTLGALLDGDYGQWRRVMDNCAVTELVLEPEPALLSFNHTGHLSGV